MEFDRGYTMESLEKIFLTMGFVWVLSFIETVRVITVFSWPLTTGNIIEFCLYLITIIACLYVVVKESLK